MLREPRFGEHEQGFNAMQGREFDGAQIQPYREVRVAWTLHRAEAVLGDGEGLAVFRAARAVSRDDSQTRYFCNGLPWERLRVDDRAINRLGAGLFKWQRVLGIAGPGTNQPRAADIFSVLDAADQAVQRMRIVIVAFAPVRPLGLELELLAVDGVADAVHVVAQLLGQGRQDFEVLLEPRSEVHEFDRKHGTPCCAPLS